MKRQRRLTLDEWECDGCGITTRVDKGETPDGWWKLPCPPEWQASRSPMKPDATFHDETCMTKWFGSVTDRAHPVTVSVVGEVV